MYQFQPYRWKIFNDLNSHVIGKHIGEVNGFPREMLSKDGKEEFCRNVRYYEGHAEQILGRYGKRKGCVVLILDITETKNYIEEITRVREQAKQANISKSAFLANMSHEIRTPMNAIVGLSDIIMEEDLERIFENFKQLDFKRNRSAEGTGLGLSITRRLAELMQGTVSVESVYCEGSTFTVEIEQKIADVRPLSEAPETEVRVEEPLEPFVVQGTGGR